MRPDDRAERGRELDLGLRPDTPRELRERVDPFLGVRMRDRDP